MKHLIIIAAMILMAGSVGAETCQDVIDGGIRVSGFEFAPEPFTDAVLSAYEAQFGSFDGVGIDEFIVTLRAKLIVKETKAKITTL